MKPSGPGLLFAGRFLIMVSISVLVMGLLRFSSSSWFSFGKFFVFLFPHGYVASESPKLLTDLPVRGFPGFWEIRVLHDSVTGMGRSP